MLCNKNPRADAMIVKIGQNYLCAVQWVPLSKSFAAMALEDEKLGVVERGS